MTCDEDAYRPCSLIVVLLKATSLQPPSPPRDTVASRTVDGNAVLSRRPLTMCWECFAPARTQRHQPATCGLRHWRSSLVTWSGIACQCETVYRRRGDHAADPTLSPNLRLTGFLSARPGRSRVRRSGGGSRGRRRRSSGSHRCTRPGSGWQEVAVRHGLRGRRRHCGFRQ